MYQYMKFYIGIMIVSFISIYWYIDIYRTSLLRMYLFLKYRRWYYKVLLFIWCVLQLCLHCQLLQFIALSYHIFQCHHIPYSIFHLLRGSYIRCFASRLFYIPWKYHSWGKIWHKNFSQKLGDGHMKFSYCI